MKKKFRALKHYLFAHAHNNYRPGIFAAKSVALFVAAMFLFEGAYLVQTSVALRSPDFLASIVPAALLRLANADRAASGVASLTEDPLLDKAAELKALDMAAKGYFSHVAPDGTVPWHWLDVVAYPYTYAGENLAVDFTDSTEVESAWMDSPTHRANIVKAHYTHLGIGVAHGMYEGRETTFVVQFFAARADAGVAPLQTLPVTKAPARSKGEKAPQQVKEASVLGSETTKHVLAVAATSPNQTMLYVLGTLAAFFTALLALALLTHAQKRVVYSEVLAGGLVLIGIASGMIVFNDSLSPEVSLAAESQSASIILTP